MAETAPTKSLVKKLAEVMKAVERIPKNGKNTFHNYKYVMEADLVETIRGKLAERHIFITSNTKGIETVELSKPTKGGEVVAQKIGILRVEYTFHDGESGEQLTMESVGEIDQDGGKGLYKALTGSMKYFLMKNFLVATGDDPEQDGKQSAVPTKPVTPKPAKPPAPPKNNQPTKEQVIEQLKAAKNFEAKKKVYVSAFAHQWAYEDGKSIADAMIMAICNEKRWLREGADRLTHTDGSPAATIEYDTKNGYATIKPVTPPDAPKPIPKLSPEELAIAESEKVGMQSM